MDDNRIQWHPGFTAAMRLELIQYADQLIFHEEYLLNAKPIQMDLLIIEKKRRAGDRKCNCEAFSAV